VPSPLPARRKSAKVHYRKLVKIELPSPDQYWTAVDTVDIGSVCDADDLDGVLVLVDSVDDPVRAPVGRIQAGQIGAERLADAAGVAGEGGIDELVAGCGHGCGKPAQITAR